MQTTPTFTPPTDPQMRPSNGPDDYDRRRQIAIQRIRDKNDFKVHLLVYLLVNTMLVLIWAITGSGYFWPVWVIGFWGIGLVMHGYTVYRGNQISEGEIDREMHRLPR
jgi:uncharacterized ion transporter superfamily protein YfcC